MAISYTVSYTFSPSTTIASSQVNTNFSDNANTWVGLEAKTKTFSNLGVDTELKSGGTVKSADGTLSAPGFTFTSNTGLGIYLSGSNLGLIGLNAWGYRRPVLQYSSGTVVNLETGINGTSGQAAVLFPDGQLRTDSTTSRINCTMSQTAAFSSTAQSGIDTGSVASNTWYSFYAAKVTDSTTNFVVTASLLSPIQSNFATLNSRLGTNGWVYLGTLPYGDNSGATTAIPKFIMAGNRVSFYNVATATASVNISPGVRLAANTGVSTLSWSYAAGSTVGTNVPAHILIGDVKASLQSGGTLIQIQDSAASLNYGLLPIPNTAAPQLVAHSVPLSQGFKQSASGSLNQDMWFVGYFDGALGIGANPLL